MGGGGEKQNVKQRTGIYTYMYLPSSSHQKPRGLESWRYGGVHVPV